jgi:hypothetical protein
MENRPIHLHWRNMYISWNNTIYVRSMSVLSILFLWEMS